MVVSCDSHSAAIFISSGLEALTDGSDNLFKALQNSADSTTVIFGSVCSITNRLIIHLAEGRDSLSQRPTLHSSGSGAPSSMFL